MSNRREFIHGVLGSTAFLAAGGVHPLSRVLAANDRVRFGLIGCGGRGQAIFKAAIKAPNTEAVAVADIYTQRLEQAKRIAPGVKTYSDFRRLLDDKSIDAVLIATPQHQHALNFVPAIQAGKDVYQEKTMAFNPDHARRMRHSFLSSNRVVQVGIQSTSSPAQVRARELVQTSPMGKITAINSRIAIRLVVGGRGQFPTTATLSMWTGKPLRGRLRLIPLTQTGSSIGGFIGTIPAGMSLKIWSTRWGSGSKR
jgi:hypothetical protein